MKSILIVLLSTASLSAWSYTEISGAEFAKVVAAWKKAPASPDLVTRDHFVYISGHCVRWIRRAGPTPMERFEQLGSQLTLMARRDPLRDNQVSAVLAYMSYEGAFTNVTWDSSYSYNPLALLPDGDAGKDKVISSNRDFFAVRKGDGAPIDYFTRRYTSYSSGPYSGSEDTYCYYWDPKAPPSNPVPAPDAIPAPPKT